VTIVAVSKTHPAASIAELAALGCTEFGEARWQELAEKVEAPELIDRSAVRWHFLGRLQRNKARAVGGACAVVHSLDRVALCAPLGRGAVDAGRTLEVFVQVSLDADAERGGVLPSGLEALADAAAGTDGLRLVGLMAVAPLGAGPLPAFAHLRTLAEQVRRSHPEARGISAGMSGDLEAAVSEGATHLRIGTALFGSRA
jgi:pyridoxal phosphate enzyme (YggS family)